MLHSKRILLAVDTSEASRRAAAYVAAILGGATGFHVGLLHLEVPPKMLEWGGAENPDIEATVSSERDATYRQLEQESKVEGKAMLRHFQALLTEKGIDVTVLLVQFEEPLDRKNIADHVLQTARDRGYGTVVVGRHLFSLWENWFQQHVGERLVHTGEGMTVWVVG